MASSFVTRFCMTTNGYLPSGMMDNSQRYLIVGHSVKWVYDNIRLMQLARWGRTYRSIYWSGKQIIESQSRTKLILNDLNNLAWLVSLITTNVPEAALNWILRSAKLSVIYSLIHWNVATWKSMMKTHKSTHVHTKSHMHPVNAGYPWNPKGSKPLSEVRESMYPKPIADERWWSSGWCRRS